MLAFSTILLGDIWYQRTVHWLERARFSTVGSGTNSLSAFADRYSVVSREVYPESISEVLRRATILVGRFPGAT